MEITRFLRRAALLAGLALHLHAQAQGVTALTGPLAELGQEATAGSKAYFDYVNARGGVHERKIRLITLDDADKASETLAQATPQAILMITAGKASFDFIKSYNKRTIGMQYFALSVMTSQPAIKALGVVVSQVSPFPFSATNRMVQEYQKVMKEMGVKNLSFASIGGFINARIMADGLKRAGRNLSRESLVDALETMGRTDYDGVAVNYTRTSHLGHRYIELTVISKDGRFLR